MVALIAVALPLAGFAVGWTLSGGPDWTPTSRSEPAPPPQTEAVSMPGEDVPGEDITGLGRYPGSVRVDYEHEDAGKIISTEVEYLAPADLDAVREFYRDAFRDEGWSVTDVGYAQNTWTFYVVDGEREVAIEIEPNGDLTEVVLEQTEPKREDTDRETAPSAQPATPAPVYDDDYGDDDFNDELDD